MGLSGAEDYHVDCKHVMSCFFATACTDVIAINNSSGTEFFSSL